MFLFLMTGEQIFIRPCVLKTGYQVEAMQDMIAGDAHHVSSWYESHCRESRKISYVQCRVAETSRHRDVEMNREGPRHERRSLAIGY
jgi:hypothetical protein